jgi:hypothetical protein
MAFPGKKAAGRVPFWHYPPLPAGHDRMNCENSELALHSGQGGGPDG